MKVLVTGFTPFGGERINPAYEAVKLLPEQIAGAQIIKLEISTAFAHCADEVESGILRHRPKMVVCIGQAGGRPCVTIERVGLNLADASIPDNAGDQPIDEPLELTGPAAYFSTLPVKAMVQNVRAHDIPCQLSYSAGTYVCNCVLYRVLHLAAVKYPEVKAGFIHVPYAEQQAVEKPGVPSASLTTIAKALEYAIEAAVQGGENTAESMGTIC